MTNADRRALYTCAATFAMLWSRYRLGRTLGPLSSAWLSSLDYDRSGVVL